MVNHKDSRKQKTFIIFTPDYVKNYPSSMLKVYALYPNYWGENIRYKGVHKWGEIPCLGYVRETSEYWAEYAALTAGILPRNDTFGPRAVEIKTKLSDTITDVVKHEVRRKPYKKYHPSTKK